MVTLLILGLVAALIFFIAPEAAFAAALLIGIFVEPLILEVRTFVSRAIAEWPWQPILTTGSYVFGVLRLLFEIRDVLRGLWRNVAGKMAKKRNRKQQRQHLKADEN